MTEQCEREKARVLVHCMSGKSRSVVRTYTFCCVNTLLAYVTYTTRLHPRASEATQCDTYNKGLYFKKLRIRYMQIVVTCNKDAGDQFIL